MPRLDLVSISKVAALVLVTLGAGAGSVPKQAQAQDTHRPPVVLDGRDLTENVYEEPPKDIRPEDIPNHRAIMRDIIAKMSDFARQKNPAFRVIVRGGAFLATQGQRERDIALLKIPPGEPLSQEVLLPLGSLHRRFAKAVDGFAMDQYFCEPRTSKETKDGIAALIQDGFHFLSLERCAKPEDARKVVVEGRAQSILVATATEGDMAFDRIPKGLPSGENSNNIKELGDSQNVLALLDTRDFQSPGEMIAALRQTNHDMLIVDPLFNGNQPLTKQQIHSLKFKALGATRLVLARLTIGLADDTRFYWKPEWTVGNPPWIVGFVPGVSGLYWVDYTHPQWLDIVGKTFAAIVEQGYDGVLLDGVTAILRDEALMPM
ncbi:MAG: alpha-1,4-polygalactosaminidase [Rhodospirillum sp.]|nr:alpha-1,4-polygalactosaminidase [Rhodospirillum sp.]MCF8488119.1 alpha-1,4-polygalactosaminidase [Rhodospirillum sp.]